MLPFPDGSLEKHGVDALKVYRQDEDHVIKLRRMNADSHWHVDAFNLTVAVRIKRGTMFSGGVTYDT